MFPGIVESIAASKIIPLFRLSLQIGSRTHLQQDYAVCIGTQFE
jgi:hypothetical protein